MIDRRRHIQVESDRFGEVLASIDPATRVPTCPEWSGAELLLEELRREATADMLDALTSRDPSEPAWSWFPADQTVGFTWRMQTHEATMHRVDAELAAGSAVSPIAPEIAADGIEHAVNVMWGWAPPDVVRHATATIELKALDTEQSWLLKTVRWSWQAWGQNYHNQIGCERTEAGEPDATIAGTVEDLDLLVWTRLDRDLVRSGDQQALSEFQAMLDEGIQ